MDSQDVKEITRLYSTLKEERLNGEVEQAYALLQKIEEILNNYDTDAILSDMSRFMYEKASIMIGEYKYREAAEFFLESGLFAKQEGDVIGEFIGNYKHMLTLYWGNAVALEEAYEQILRFRNELESLDNIQPHKEYLKKAFSYNSLADLADIAFELNLPTFKILSDAILQSDYMIDNHANPRPIMELEKTQFLARQAMYERKYDIASSAFITYLDLKLPTVAPSSSIWQPHKLTHFAHLAVGDGTRDYRDLGRSLCGATYPDNHELAALAWERGLRIPENKSNERYLADIRQDFASLNS